ncbi:hypothetical protein ABEB36_015133 [Hypothenemus hampei]|uniref:CCHC-type domain-containing protein n=1 Tax=Hypothenemus hampei TaxID=57062 RepID=A0ABD1E0S4_HYPHA
MADELINTHNFRRQVYILPEDIGKVPEMIQIQYEDTKYNIFFTSDTLNCFLCKESGHIAKNCPKFQECESLSKSKNKNEETVLGQNSDLSSPVPTPPLVAPPTINPVAHEDSSNILAPDLFPSFKRPLSSSLSSASNSLNVGGEVKNKKKRKKSKIEQSGTPPIDLEPSFKEIIDNKLPPYPLNYSHLQNFLGKTVGKKEIKQVVSETGADPVHLIQMLRDIYLQLSSRGMKNRFSRLINKITKEFNLDPVDQAFESDSIISTNDESSKFEVEDSNLQ